jgi:hypothetical protein
MEHRKEIDQARAAGRLQPGSYVAMRVKFIGRQARWIVEDYGPAEEAVNNAGFLKDCMNRGVNPREHGLGGWLGNFRDAMRGARGAHAPTRKRSQSRKA